MFLHSFDHWERHGFECDILATSHSEGTVAGQFRECGYAVFHLPFRGNLRYLPRFGFVHEFFKLCRSGYDVVHVQTEAAVPLFVVLAKLAGVPRIAVTPHNTFLFRGLLRWRKMFERFLLRAAGVQYGMISDGVQECEWERFRNKGVRIWNWFDTAHFRPPSPEERASIRELAGVGRDDFAIVSIGNCNAAKNHPAMLRAIPLVRGKIKPLYMHIGREEPDHPERRLAEELMVADEVRFLGSQADPLPFLWAADAFVMPSLNEGLGIAALEAIAAGVPAILADVAGPREIAGECEWTILVSPDPESIAEGILRLASIVPDERFRNALEDSRIIRERYSVENGVRSVVNSLYRDSAGSSQKTAPQEKPL